MTTNDPHDSSPPKQNALPEAQQSNPSFINDLYVKDVSTQSGDNLILEDWAKELIVGKNDTAIVSRVVWFQCDKSKDVRVAIASDSQRYAARILCTCGNTHRILLDSRHCSRKPVKLEGFYVDQNDDTQFGKIVVEDLSFTGLKFYIISSGQITYDDLLYVEFILDDEEETFIREKVRVRYLCHDIIGAEFTDLSKINKKLVLYLMQ